jgi:predicted cation transporter
MLFSLSSPLHVLRHDVTVEWWQVVRCIREVAAFSVGSGACLRPSGLPLFYKIGSKTIQESKEEATFFYVITVHMSLQCTCHYSAHVITVHM